MGDKTVHQHFVPQFYLRQFADQKDKVSVIFKNGKMVPDSVSKVASRRYFYDSWLNEYIQGWGDQPVEQMLGKLESIYSQALLEFVKQLRFTGKIDRSSKDILAKWLYLQLIRTPHMRKNFDPIPVGEKFLDEQLVQIYGISQMGDSNNSFVKNLMSKSWEIRKSIPDILLPTSDNPVTVGSPGQNLLDLSIFEDTRDFLLKPQVTISYALDPHFLLVVYGDSNRNDSIGVRDLTIEEQLNYMVEVIVNADRQIFTVPGDKSEVIMQSLVKIAHSKESEFETQKQAAYDKLGWTDKK